VSPCIQDVGQAGEGFLQQFSVQLDLHLASNMREHEHHLYTGYISNSQKAIERTVSVLTLQER
jgi:hypothetical protein